MRMDSFSLFIYLLTFLLSCAFIHISQKMLYDKDKECRMGIKNLVVGYFLLLCGIFIPCLLAAMRGLDVGMDMGYVIPNIMDSPSLHEKGFIYYYNNMPEETEIGFAYLMYLGNIVRGFGLPFFIIQFLIIAPIYITLTKYRRYLSVTLGMAVYFFLFFNLSLCIIRGSVAMSIMPLVFYYLQEKKYLSSIILLLYAISFHNSAILVFMLGYYLHFIMRSRHKKCWLYITSIIVISMFSLIIKYAFIFTTLVGLVNLRYAGYMNTYLGSGSLEDIPSTDLLCKSLLIVLVTLILLRTKKFSNTCQHLLIFALFGRIFVLFNGVFYEAMRFAFYFDVFLVFYVSSIFYSFKDSFFNRKVVVLIILILPFFYWIYFIMYIGAYQTNIYTFR